MQVFLPYPNDLTKSVQSLDDLRLNKQITEINQILLTYVNGCGGHSEHPVNKWYKSKQGWEFLKDYSMCLCTEYTYRFGRIHMGYFATVGLSKHGEWHNLGLEDEITFTPAYIKDQVNKDQIITTDNVGELYRKLLCEKWDGDKVVPKWTGRTVPEFYKVWKENTHD